MTEFLKLAIVIGLLLLAVLTYAQGDIILRADWGGGGRWLIPDQATGGGASRVREGLLCSVLEPMPLL